jgi:hypothetical protein
MGSVEDIRIRLAGKGRRSVRLSGRGKEREREGKKN